jgi:hypothetical protein
MCARPQFAAQSCLFPLSTIAGRRTRLVAEIDRTVLFRSLLVLTFTFLFCQDLHPGAHVHHAPHEPVAAGHHEARWQCLRTPPRVLPDRLGRSANELAQLAAIQQLKVFGEILAMSGKRCGQVPRALAWRPGLDRKTTPLALNGLAERMKRTIALSGETPNDFFGRKEPFVQVRPVCQELIDRSHDAFPGNDWVIYPLTSVSTMPDRQCTQATGFGPRKEGRGRSFRSRASEIWVWSRRNSCC